MAKADTILSHVWIIGFQDVPDDEKHLRIAMGTVMDDKSGRFAPGNWCLTSLIQSYTYPWIQTDGVLFEILGPVEAVELPLSTLELLQQGMTPDQALGFILERKVQACERKSYR